MSLSLPPNRNRLTQALHQWEVAWDLVVQQENIVPANYFIGNGGQDALRKFVHQRRNSLQNNQFLGGSLDLILGSPWDYLSH